MFNAELFNNGRVIAATRSDGEFLRAVSSGAELIFDLDTDVMSISAKLKRAHDAGKRVFVHVDLAQGIGKDRSGMMLLKKLGVDGVISTKVSIVKAARDSGLLTVQRFFIVDSQSVHTTVEAVKASKPDMVEIMPGTVCRVIRGLVGELSVPIIAGGLIENDADARDALESGAAAISTGCERLWRELDI